MGLFLATIIAINIAVVFITDITDWPNTLKSAISFILTRGVIKTNNWKCHLIDCSLCQVFHLSWIWTLIYSLCLGQFNVWMIPIVCISAYFTTIVKDLLYLIKDVFTKAIKKISDLL